MLLSLWPNFWDEWNLLHKVTFDGENKCIIIAPEVTEIDFEVDVYSAWKEWLQVLDNSKWEAALRNVGGDPTVGTDRLGNTFFLINGWQILIDHGVTFEGNYFSDDFPTPYKLADENQQITTQKVSNLVDKVQAPNLDLIDIDGLTLEQAIKAVLAVLTGKMDVTINGDGPGLDNVKFNAQDGVTPYVEGSVQNGVRVASQILSGSL